MAHGILAKLVFGSISNFKIFVSVSLVGENLRGLREYLTHKIRILIDCDTSSAASTAASTAEVTSPPIMQNRKQHLNKLKLALPLKQRLQIVADSSQVCYLLKQFDTIQYLCSFVWIFARFLPRRIQTSKAKIFFKMFRVKQNSK